MLLLKSWLLGMAHTTAPATDFADELPIDIKDLDESLTFEEATKFSRGRMSMTRDEFYALSAKLRKKAFTVGRLTQLDMIEKAKGLYLNQLEGATSSLTDFVKAIRSDVDATGLPGYYETVYRTNIQTDYNAGRAMELAANQPQYLEFIGIEDGRQTDICRVRSGVILPYDDPWWNDNWPPLHYNCRSTVRAIYQEEADILGLKPTARPRSSKASAVQGGFGINPVKNTSYWDPTPAQQQRIKDAGIQLELDLFDK
ncbi:MAG: hypothetical protein EOM68_26305 [Spirochaetia bacterium]|nr:hypothetical protein [Spirochaetia bacterium]